MINELRVIHNKTSQKYNSLKEGEFYSNDGYRNSEGGGNTYDITFKNALENLGCSSFRELFAIRKKSGLTNNVLDLMGSGIFPYSRDYTDIIIGLRVSNKDEIFRQKASRIHKKDSLDVEETFDDPNRYVIEGNVYSRTGYMQVQRKIEELNITGFDIITCRPDGPFSFMTLISDGLYDMKSTPDYFGIQLRRYLKLLNDGGLMFVQVPEIRKIEEQLSEVKKFLGDNYDVGVFESTYPRDSKNIVILKKSITKQ